MGYVQAPQGLANQRASWISRAAAEETYGYYSSTQMTLYAAGYPVVTGCHQLHRTVALRGVACHEADDLLITLFYLDPRERGLQWRAGLARVLKTPWIALGAVDIVRSCRGYVITTESAAPAPDGSPLPSLAETGTGGGA
ncbi:MAG: hypothetical protein ACR2KP_20365 [Egibacteraceae bacterium]